jgi:CelD/BcsL family acetyltransferase involved in cellulose biosynthesis
MESLQIRVYETLADLERLRSSWEGLLAEFCGATTFSSWEWLVPWWRAFGGDRQLLVLAFVDPAERLVGLAPLSVERRRLISAMNLRVLRLLGDGSGDSDNLDFPVRAGYEDQIARMLLDYLAKESKLWDCCELNTMPAGSAVGKCLESQLGARAWITYRHQNSGSVVSIGKTWESYLSQLSAKERGKIAYRRKLLEKKYRVRIYKCENQDRVSDCLTILFNLHQKRWQNVGEPGSFSSAARRQFYGELASLLVDRGWLQFWFLALDDQPVAAQFGFQFGSTVFSLQEGYDPQYSAESVGYVLRAHVIRQLISEGVRRYDFLAGEGSTKSRWGAQASIYVNLHFARPRTAGSLYLQLTNGASAGKEWLRCHLPRNLWQVLHWLNTTGRGTKKRL